MVAIETKFLPPTATRGARIKAQRMDKFGSALIVPWDHSQSVCVNHRLAAQEFAANLDWHELAWRGGSTRTGYVWIVASCDWLRFGTGEEV